MAAGQNVLKNGHHRLHLLHVDDQGPGLALKPSFEGADWQSLDDSLWQAPLHGLLV